MQNRELSRQIQQLNSLVQRADEASNSNAELQSEWAKYLCVLAAGLLENAIKELYTEFAKRKVAAPIASYVSSSLSPIKNPKHDVFLRIAAAFNDGWKTELENYLIDNERGVAINSIISNRHLIAHGQSRNSSITVARLKDFLSRSIEALEFIEQQCKR